MSKIDLNFTLADVYERERGRTYMSGVQALVRLPMMQRRLDRRRGLNTAGLVSGYRGSPLGGYDQQLWKAVKQLTAEDIVFQPGLNEDLAATALWGAQMHRAFGPVRTDGVFGIWYGKGPGVDRTGDVFRTANMMGASPLGGVLAVAGDDHAAQSSTIPHQTDGIFQAVSMPVLQPSSVAEILSLGLAGFALSRFSGLWVGMKTIAEVVEAAGAFDLPEPYPRFLTPENFSSRRLNWDPGLAWPADRAELERRLIDDRLPAALAWSRANRLDREIVATPNRRLGVVTVGKAHQDLMQALSNLGLDGWALHRLGVGVYKVAMSWPLETTGLRAFADGCSELIVVEEKRGLVEAQVKEALYDMPAARRPRVFGKVAEGGEPLLPEVGELNPLVVARAVAGRLIAHGVDGGLADRLGDIEARAKRKRALDAPNPSRAAFFCAGCPHNTSTRVPQGSIAGGGIGCHVMALAIPERSTPVFSQMGGEGMQWVGAAAFSQTGHTFQNLGDGTYQHSGLLAIRAAVAARTNITFKILYNDAVAMTGGQAAEGVIDPARITRQLAAESVERVALVSDDPAKWRGHRGLAEGVSVHHRDELDTVQRAMREIVGVTAIIYEQTCAAQLRRRRKAGAAADSDRRLFINPRVCEGCGDCSVQSNCIAIEPLETAFGRKRKINQSACNKDVSCLKGFCPSFLEIEGPVLRKPAPDRLAAVEAERFAALPTPNTPTLTGAYNIYIAGIGGLGVLTIGALLGAAAHLEGKGVSVLDFTGMAQKNGAVVSQVRIARQPSDLNALRIAPGEADLMLATDMVASSAPEAVATLSRARSGAVINLDVTPTAAIVTRRDTSVPALQMLNRLKRELTPERTGCLRASHLAQALFGDALCANTLMLGYAWQKGLVPLSEAAIERAIELNGAAVALNKRAFNWGRAAALDLAEVERIAGLAAPPPALESLDDLIEHRAADLILYQSAAYSERYRRAVAQARAAGASVGDRNEDFARAVATQGYRLMAYKDEYEVARLYADPAMKAELSAQFSEIGKLSIWLAPPLISKIDPATGRPAKRKFGPWVFLLFSGLSRLKGLRGTAFDPFGRTDERRAERRLAAEYLTMVDRLSAEMTQARLQISVNLAAAASEIRGFGPVKAAAIAAYHKACLAMEAGEAVSEPAHRHAAE